MEHNVFLDKATENDADAKVLPGTPVRRKISETLDRSNVMLLIDAPSALGSGWIMHDMETTKPLSRANSDHVPNVTGADHEEELFMSESKESTKSVRIVALDWGPDYYRDLRQQLVHRGIRCDLTLIENFFITECTAEKVRKVKEVLRGGRDEFTVLIPYTTELYLKEADLSLLFSAYGSRHAPDREKIIPWVWSNTSAEAIPDLKDWRWSTKPVLSVGFQGNSYESRKCVRWSLRLPKQVKDQLLAGRHLPFVYRGGRKMASIVPYLPCFARVEALKTLEKAGLRTDVVRLESDRKFDSQEEAQQDYERHMFRNAYMLCPRGIENYSFRFYETLAHGRIPVLIDTETVLPLGTDWNELCIKIPFAELGHLEERIVQDYESRTAADFIDRQEKAFKAFDRLRRMGWLSEIVEDIVAALR